MLSPKHARFIANWHKWLGLIIGLQVILWTLSGLFFTLFPIEKVRGEHLTRDLETVEIDWNTIRINSKLAAELNGYTPHSAELKMLLGKPVWLLKEKDLIALVSADTGKLLSPIDKTTARDIALASWQGGTALTRMKFFIEGPPEYGRDGAVWQVSFEGANAPTLYINAHTGEVETRRTNLWRVFDFFWKLHIMDWQTGENFNSWWLMLFALGAVNLSILGFILVIQRFTRQKRYKN